MHVSPNPTDYQRRILLAVTGLTPQVVTETLYALTQQQSPAFIPTEIHLVTTGEGADHAQRWLLSDNTSDNSGWFHRLCRDCRLPPIAFGREHIHVFKDAHGNSLEDIRSPEDNESVANTLTDMVRKLTADERSALHVSLAGGRKTMGYYAGYALSIFGRPQDRLSHVLVSELFESSESFFYPEPKKPGIDVGDGRMVNCADAPVTLIEIPFVRLRGGLPPRFLNGRAQMSDVIAAANRMLQPPLLVLDIGQKRVWADDTEIHIKPTELSLLLLLAERVHRGEPEVDRSSPKVCDEFLEKAKQVMGDKIGDYERLEKAMTGSGGRKNDPKLMAEYFEPHKSRLNEAFKEALGEQASQRYLVQSVGKRSDQHSSRYCLMLTEEQIEIRQ